MDGMNGSAWLPLMVVASALLPGLVIFCLPEKKVRTRTVLNLAGAFSKILLTGWMLWGD